MGNWSDLKKAVAQVIKQNGNQEITGQILQNTLNTIISNVGQHATFVDIATPSTNPGTPDGNVFYIASQAGTYANFGGISLDGQDVCILQYDGATWTAKSTGAATKSAFESITADVNKKLINRVELSALDFDLKTIGKIITANVPCQFVVMQKSKNVGVLHCFSDDSQHMMTQVFTTHCITPFSYSTHTDDKIYQYFRSYHLRGGTSDIPQGTWGEWNLVYSSDNDSRMTELEEQIKKGVGGNKILEWNTDAETTRKQVPSEERKAGLQISYKNADGVWVNEQYVGTELDDYSWGLQINWQKFLSLKQPPMTIEGIDTYSKKKYKKKDTGVMSSGGANYEYVKNFYPVSKGVKIRVISAATSDKSIIAFYRSQREEDYVESVNAYDNGSKTDISIQMAEYTPSEDGYVRVYGVNNDITAIYNFDLQKILEIPTIILGAGEIQPLDNFSDSSKCEIEGYENDFLINNNRYLNNNRIGLSSMGTDQYTSKPIRVKKGDKITLYSNHITSADIFQVLSKEQNYECIYSVKGNADKTVTVEYLVTEDGLILFSYNKKEGEWSSKGEYNGKKLPYLKIERPSEGDDTQDTLKPVTTITELEGVQDYSLENLFDKNSIRAYDSDFANKVNDAIGRKTDSTGCYSNNIPCKKGDWFTRSDFGTGIVVVLDGDENILGDIKNAAYTPTIQVVESEGQDFTNAVYIVFVVPVANVDTEKIVKAKYLPLESGDYFKMPKFRLDQLNIPNGLDYPIKSTSGRFYSIIVDDSGEEPYLKFVQQEGIPMSDLPQNFPLFSIIGDFSKYYDYLIFCPIEGGVTNYLYQLSPTGLVARYINKKLNCPRILKESDTWYFYGVDGTLNTSSGKLNIYKAKEETFELVKGDLGNSKGEAIEPHDCLVLSVSPLHYICQRYVPNQTTTVDGEGKVVTALHLEEIYEGKSVWEWHSEDYPELWTDSHIQSNNADYLHNNTISIGNDGNLYINNKHANQILVIKRTWDNSQHIGTIGEILWKIGGDSYRSGWDVPTRIKTEEGQQWYESHDAVINGDNTITMFDNGDTGASRILNFNINTDAKTLDNFKEYTYNGYKGRYMGSVDRAAEGIYLVSWGSSRSGNTANAGVYDFNTGKALFEIRFNATGSSAYRVYGIKKGQ